MAAFDPEPTFKRRLCTGLTKGNREPILVAWRIDEL